MSVLLPLSVRSSGYQSKVVKRDHYHHLGSKMQRHLSKSCYRFFCIHIQSDWYREKQQIENAFIDSYSLPQLACDQKPFALITIAFYLHYCVPVFELLEAAIKIKFFNFFTIKTIVYFRGLAFKMMKCQ